MSHIPYNQDQISTPLSISDARPDPPENLDTQVGFLAESEFLLVSLVMLNSIPMITVCISQKSLVILRKQGTQLLIYPSLPYCT